MNITTVAYRLPTASRVRTLVRPAAGGHEMTFWPIVPVGWIAFMALAYSQVGDEDEQGPFALVTFVPVFLMLLTKALP